MARKAKFNGRFTKRGVALLSSGALLALTACGDSGAAGDDHPEPDVSLTVGVAPDFFYSHYYFAVREGFLAAEGIDASLTEFPSGREASEAIVAGQADVTGTTSSTLTVLAESDNDLVAIASEQRGDGWYGVVTNGDVDVSDVSDLEDLNIGTEHRTVLDQNVRAFLDSQDLGVDEIDYSDVNLAQLLTGLTRGDYEAASMWEPNVSSALANIDGAEVVLNSDEVMPAIGFMAVSPQVHEDEDVAHRLLTALDNTVEWMADNPDAVMDHVMETSGIDDEEVAEAVQEKITYEVGFSDEAVDDLYESRDFHVEQEIVGDVTEEQIAEMYDTELIESWEADQD